MRKAISLVFVLILTLKQEIPRRFEIFWGWRWDSNPQPTDYKSARQIKDKIFMSVTLYN